MLRQMSVHAAPSLLWRVCNQPGPWINFVKPVSSLPMNFVTILDILSRSFQTSRVAIYLAAAIGFCAAPVAGVSVTGHFKVHHLRSLESAPLWRLGGVG